MSMSTTVIGVKPKDEKWNKMQDAYNACKSAGIEVPEEVEEFFDYNDPNEMDGLEVDMDEHEAVEGYFDDGREGYTIEIAKLPKDIKYIRVVNCY